MFRELQQESVLLNLHDESYYALNQSGTYLWHLLLQEGSLRAAFLRFQDHYKLEDARALKDFNAIVEELLTKQFGTLTPING